MQKGRLSCKVRGTSANGAEVEGAVVDGSGDLRCESDNELWSILRSVRGEVSELKSFTSAVVVTRDKTANNVIREGMCKTIRADGKGACGNDLVGMSVIVAWNPWSVI